ncbi:Pentatricopeptide repeat-containing protein [Nymphaea thermarum]|nr:Pentatricopeptide repeat-containing protein [Nymphaea thermarum]
MNPPGLLATKANSSILVSLLQKCATESSANGGRQLHALLLVSGINPRPYVYNNLLAMYAKCGYVDDAKKVFDQTPQRTVVTWNAIISAFSTSALHAVTSFELYCSMGGHGVRPNQATFISLLQASTLLADYSRVSMIHSQVIKSGCSGDVRIQSSLVGSYGKCGRLECAQLGFDEISEPDTIAWNSLIVGLLHNNRFRHCLLHFCSMLLTDSKPNEFTYSIVLNACSRSEDRLMGRTVHARIIRTVSFPDTTLLNSLLDMYSNVMDPEAAYLIFTSISSPDLVTWNSMLAACAQTSDAERAMSLFMNLQHKSREVPDEYTYASVLSASASAPAFIYGMPLHACAIKRGFERIIYVASTLIDMYFKNDEPLSACKMFDAIEDKDVVIWTAMITGYSSIGYGEKAIEYLCAMQQEGKKADQFVLSSSLSSCADLASQRQGEMIHSLVVKTGYTANMFAAGSLVDMYAKTGCLPAAVTIFSEISEPDLKCWNTMLGGYSYHGKAEDAFRLFDGMLQNGVKPDHVTFISLLSACSHSGLLERGRAYWNYMRGFTGLSPGPKHYACMVSLLSRDGFLKEAEELIESSPPSCNPAEQWRILLSSCITYNDLEMGLKAANQAFLWEPDSIETHVLLSNIYAADGRWDDVSQVRRRIRNLMVEKNPGLSWIEINKESHAFVASDQIHPKIENIQLELQKLKKHMILSDGFTNVD